MFALMEYPVVRVFSVRDLAHPIRVAEVHVGLREPLPVLNRNRLVNVSERSSLGCCNRIQAASDVIRTYSVGLDFTAPKKDERLSPVGIHREIKLDRLRATAAGLASRGGSD